VLRKRAHYEQNIGELSEGYDLCKRIGRLDELPFFQMEEAKTRIERGRDEDFRSAICLTEAACKSFQELRIYPMLARCKQVQCQALSKLHEGARVKQIMKEAREIFLVCGMERQATECLKFLTEEDDH